MVTARFRFVALVGVLAALLTLMLVGSAGAQGFPSLPSLTGASSSQPSYMNPFDAPGAPYGSDTVPLSSGLFAGLLPRIPNLEFGFVYAFGPNLRAGRGTIDYVLPIGLDNKSVIFGEAHAEFQDFWKSQKAGSITGPGFVALTTPANNRTDLSIGGGYRRVLGGSTLLGVSGFFDTTKIFEKWYSAGSVGLEMVSNLSDNAAVDVRANWYGNLFSRDVFINAFRNKGGSYDIGAGYNHALFDQALDLRLSFTGYQFDVGQAVYGWKAGAGLTTRDGAFSVKYEHGYDRVNRSYDEIGGFVNVGFQMENLLRGESPVTMPEPVFKSPRSLTYWLTQKVKRNWHQPTPVVVARGLTNSSSTSDAIGPTPYFLFSVGPVGSGYFIYNADPGNATATMRVQPSVVNYALWYTVTVVGTTGLTFPLTAVITPTKDNATLILVRPDGVIDTPQSITFPDSSTLTIQVIGPIGSPAVPDLFAGPAGSQGTITITAPGVQTLTITIPSP
jgi:hypothetical protein